MSYHPPRHDFRPDVQGLRAIAVGLVLLYHAGVPPFSGGYIGVDVFFVLSGYLISSHLLEAIERDGRVAFARFYARRARRILPASFTVAIGTTIALVFVAPPLSLPGMLQDALATMLYVPNIWFAIQETDYLADHEASPFQHYWSLGVEEQFYLLWPLVLLVIVLLVRRRRAAVMTGIAGIAALSFAAGVVATQTQQPIAFFLLHTRAWELLVGALVAALLLKRTPQLPSWLAAIGGWLGLVAVVGAGFVFDDATPFPGWRAAIPVVGTAMVVLFGAARAPGGPTWLLSTRPLQFVGLISYSLYLVHWPLLIVPRVALGSEPLPLWANVLLGIVVALPLAWLLFRLVEEPMRGGRLARRRPRDTLLWAGAVTAVLALAITVAFAWSVQRPIAGGPDVAAITGGPVAPPPETTAAPANLVPSLRDVATDVPAVYADGCHHDTISTDVQDCEYGNSDGSFRVALFGDSHTAQWLPALEWMAESDAELTVQAYTKSSCPAVDVTVLVRNLPYDSCNTWRANVMAHLVEEPPDLVVISSYSAYPLDGAPTASARLDEWSAGLTTTVDALEDAGIDVLVIADTPHFDEAPPTCVSDNLTDVTVCAADPATALDAQQTAAEKEAVETSGAMFADLTPYICSPDTCPVIIGDMLVYRDINHLTTVFVRYLAPALVDSVDSARS